MSKSFVDALEVRYNARKEGHWNGNGSFVTLASAFVDEVT